jgi:uncharacterized protein YxjI
MKIKKYNEFVNEEISMKGIATGILAGGLALGYTGCEDGSVSTSAPTEQRVTVKKEIPSKFILDEELMSIGSDFEIKNSSDESFGRVEERTLSSTRKFEYFDNTGKLVASARSRFLSIKTIIDIKDGNGIKIGTVEEEVLESLGSLIEGKNVYSILDANGNLIGKSKADEFIKNNVQIYDNTGKLIAKFHTPALSITANWKCEVTSNIDKRLIIFIPAYITAKSNDKDKDE